MSLLLTFDNGNSFQTTNCAIDASHSPAVVIHDSVIVLIDTITFFHSLFCMINAKKSLFCRPFLIRFDTHEAFYVLLVFPALDCTPISRLRLPPFHPSATSRVHITSATSVMQSKDYVIVLRNLATLLCLGKRRGEG